MLGIDLGKFSPKHWAGFMPFGFGIVKPKHFTDMVSTLWENRDNLSYAWKILTKGVCDGCALGTTGIRDYTLDGVHLCNVRLSLLRLNTVKGFAPGILEDVSRLKKMGSKELLKLGRVPFPFIRRKGENRFNRIMWDDALGEIADKIRNSTPERIAFYLTSRGISNEVYYVAQKLARFLGTNNVDNSARLCHSPSTVAMKQSLGVAASTCSYKDWIGSDLLVFFGSNTPNNQPVTTKYIYYAKMKGAKVAVVNTIREPGFDRYWIPSILESSVFGTKLADDFFYVNGGGDIAFISGAMKLLIENDWIDRDFIGSYTKGYGDLKQYLAGLSWEQIEASSGATRDSILKFARMYSEAKSAIFVWSMGLTQHVFGVDNIFSVINLALLRGNIGREKTGLMPIRGHSGVQGGAEVGAVPNKYPGGLDINEKNSARLYKLWGFKPPTSKGLDAVDMITGAYKGNLDLLYSSGGNFLDTLPDPEMVRVAMSKIPVRVHQDIILSTQMMIDPAETVILLPAATRYEQEGGATETTTERRIIYSPKIEGHQVGEALSEWIIFTRLGEKVRPELADKIKFLSGNDIRKELSQAVPFYKGVEGLKEAGDMVQYGGERLCDGNVFPTEDGFAHFFAIHIPNFVKNGKFFLSTRRGKQFNSIVHKARDPLTGADRESVFMNPDDANKLSLNEGSLVTISNEKGSVQGRVKIINIQPGNIQMFWPEANPLFRIDEFDKRCGVPDYNSYVSVERRP